ncbi:MAG: hypothetical protein B7O98_02230 [Zestosphaera tikiterensis]|uniref:HTH asnC-type domain-containing protein n=1 Tax=Zestosphaera tikiterensis TaxID=1973259 RepID=A0A2R7Y6W2_9CREN|nr:MAG: hypothetical protein B7O98_02230 [Zestosphaera tikiterensis]
MFGGSSDIDAKDLYLLKELVVKGKVKVREVARELGLTPSALVYRVKKLEREGYIRKYTAIIDYRKLGYQINALTLLQVNGAHIEEVENLLAKEPNVKAVYDITGEYDVAVIASFKSVEDLDKFVKRLLKIPYVKRSTTSIAFRVVKETPHIEEFLRDY